MRLAVGVFDSGVGGLGVLAALRDVLPGVPLLYLADSANAPYGERSPTFILARSLAMTRWLVARGTSLVVIACNTATAIAADEIRRRHPGLEVVGIEPGIKPAVALSRSRRVGVLATPATLASARFQALVARHASDARITTVACSGIVRRIEAGDLDSPELRALVARYCAPLVEAGVDAVLLGCTHYPFIRSLWQEALGPDVRLVRVEEAVARQAARLWTARPRSEPGVPACPRAEPRAEDSTEPIRLATTGSTEVLRRLARALALGEAMVESVEGAEPEAGGAPERPDTADFPEADSRG